MTAQKTSLFNAFETQLSASVGAADLTFNVDTTAPLTSPCYLVIDPTSASKREYVLFDGAFTSTSFVTTSTANRGLGGSAAGAQSHAAGTTVRCVPMHQHFGDLNDRIDVHVDDLDLGTAGPHSIQFAATAPKANLSINVKNAPYGAVGDGVTDDTAAINAAASDAGDGTLFFPRGTYLYAGTWALTGLSCNIVGEGPGTIIRASGQNGPVMDFTGFVYPTDFLGSVVFRDFVVEGDNTAAAASGDYTKSGIKTGNLGFAHFSNVLSYKTGGPAWHFAGTIVLCSFEHCEAGRPVSAGVNNIPYVYGRGPVVGNHFANFGLRSITSAGDAVAGGFVLEDDGTGGAGQNVFTSCWDEFLHVPTNGSVVRLRGADNKINDWHSHDTVKVTAATGTCHIRLQPMTVVGFEHAGGNVVRGKLLGSSKITGVVLEQGRNRVEGVRDFDGGNVELAAGVDFCYVELGGQWQGTASPATAPIIDNSGTTTNVLLDWTTGDLKMGSVRLRRSAADQWQMDDRLVVTHDIQAQFVSKSIATHSNYQSSVIWGEQSAQGDSTAYNLLYLSNTAGNRFRVRGNGGPQIQNAATIYSGAVAPATGLGVDGDFYFRTDTPGTANQRLYVKNAGAWDAIL